jgi:hypothetical protein
MRLEFTSGNMAKGQVLSLDFMVASILLFMVLAFLAVQVGYELKNTQETRQKEALISGADQASNIFFSEGYPKDWIPENVEILGMESKGRLSMQKLEYFNQTPYSTAIGLLGVNNDFNITILNGQNEIISFGKPYDSASSVVKRERLGVLENGTLVNIKVIIFEK